MKTTGFYADATFTKVTPTVTHFDKSKKGHFARHDVLVIRFDGLYHKDVNIRLHRKDTEKLIKALQKTLIVKYTK